MPKFKYVVRDTNGKASSGVLEAKDQAELRRMLRVNDLFLTKVRETGRSEIDPKAEASGSLFDAKVKARDIVVLVRQMATLVRAGVPFTDGLVSLQTQTEKVKLKAMLKDLERGVMEGRSLSSCMKAHPAVFNTLTVSLVEAGEDTGTLDKSLEISAEQLDRQEDLRTRVKAALVYPKIVVLAAVGTVALMLLLVVPTFKMVYAQFHGTLPAPTVALLAISDFCTHFWWLLALVIGGGWYGLKEYAKTIGGARAIDRNVLKIPIVGPLLRKIAVARFAQTLATGVRGGVPVLRALQLSAQTAGNSVIRDAVIGTIAKVRDGEPMADELEKSGQFPAMVTQMMRSGEVTGNLDHMLEEINRYYDQDIRYSIDKMTKMIEPVITIVVGVIVLFVLLALYMPIFNLGKTVSGGG
jgi:type II secretory pathway component PulF